MAIVGAESTGKTALAESLAGRLAQQAGLRATWVPELLREWCERERRTPRIDEQAGLMRAQHERIDAAAANHDVVVCDTTALMTAVYSRIVFGDRSLDAAAVALHRSMSLTLLTSIDLPWVADGLQREGPHVRAPVDAALRELLSASALPWTLIAGQGTERLASAWRSVAAITEQRVSPGVGRAAR